jgi:hypothetical protein
MELCHYNIKINTVLNYKQEVLTVFPEVDIFALNETRIPSPATHLSLPDYNLFREDRPETADGGIESGALIWMEISH